MIKKSENIQPINNVHQHKDQSMQLVIRSNEEFINITELSPYSNKTETQRLCELNQQVNEAKLALRTFTKPTRVSIIVRIRRMLNSA